MAADEKTEQETPREPRGFGEHSRGLAGEYAHEQGWGLDVEERTKQPDAPRDIDGGTDYDYGAQDFGDTPVNTSIPLEERDQIQNTPSPATQGANEEKKP